jgi:hypothetical protein
MKVEFFTDVLELGQAMFFQDTQSPLLMINRPLTPGGREHSRKIGMTGDLKSPVVPHILLRITWPTTLKSF